MLNAKEHAREAEIIKDAGQRGAVTIATNMAGRGVDIKLGEGVRRARRPLRARHRAPRVAPHRQPAPRPLRPPGRPRRDALLPLGRGRPRAPVRRRPDQGDHGALQDPGRPADGGEDPQPADRGRAEEGRGAELRHAQERPQVRRRAQPAPRTHLRAAPAGARGRRHVGSGEALDRRAHRGDRAPVHGGARTRRSGISRRSRTRWPRSTRRRSPRRSCARISARRHARGADRGVPDRRARRVRREGGGVRRRS